MLFPQSPFIIPLELEVPDTSRGRQVPQRQPTVPRPARTSRAEVLKHNRRQRPLTKPILVRVLLRQRVYFALVDRVEVLKQPGNAVAWKDESLRATAVVVHSVNARRQRKQSKAPAGEEKNDAGWNAESQTDNYSQPRNVFTKARIPEIYQRACGDTLGRDGPEEVMEPMLAVPAEEFVGVEEA